MAGVAAVRASTGALVATAAVRAQQAPAQQLLLLLLLLLLRGLQAHQKKDVIVDSMVDTRQIVSGSQTRLIDCCGRSSSKGPGPPSCWSPCATALSRVCARSTGICSERVCCFVFEGYPPITRRGGSVIFGDIRRAKSTEGVVYYVPLVIKIYKQNSSTWKK